MKIQETFGLNGIDKIQNEGIVHFVLIDSTADVGQVFTRPAKKDSRSQRLLPYCLNYD